RAADAHGEIDALLENIDESVGERHPRTQFVMLPGKVENQWQHMQAAKRGRQVDA
ncbi:hypothetical protein APX70_01601, partial [Pseudomonas syringae pv. maculicola]